jgi:hypothetical protein
MFRMKVIVLSPLIVIYKSHNLLLAYLIYIFFKNIMALLPCCVEYAGDVNWLILIMQRRYGRYCIFYK